MIYASFEYHRLKYNTSDRMYLKHDEPLMTFLTCEAFAAGQNETGYV